MTSFDDPEWTQSEQDMLAQLRETDLDLSGQEDRTLAALKHRRLIGKRHSFSWMRPLQLAGMAAALGLAFFAGTRYSPQQEPVVQRVLVPVQVEQPVVRTAMVAANYDLMDESYSPANAHPKERMSRSRSRDR